MEKKDAKLKETTTLLEEEITPTLNKLKADRSAYLEYQKFNVCALQIHIYLYLLLINL